MLIHLLYISWWANRTKQNYPDDKHDMLSFLLADLMSETPKALTNLNAVYADCQSILSGSV